MPSPLEQFRANDRTRFDRDFWERFRKALVAEIEGLKAVSTDWQAAVQQLNAFGLARINEVLAPAYAEIVSLANLGALLQVASTSNVGVAAGETEFVIAAADRNRFAPAGYLWATAADESGAAMAGQFVSYDRLTGVLRINVDHAVGAGAHEGWSIAIGLPPDLNHSTRTDNPHAVTAVQVGAYTQAEVDAAIAAAVAALKAGVGGALDTLDELSAALGDDANFAATVTAALALRALKSGDIYTGSHDYSGATLIVPRTRTIAGAAVAYLGSKWRDVLAAHFSTTSDTYVEALLGSERAREFAAPGAAVMVYARLSGTIYARRAAYSGGGVAVLEYRIKTAGAWGGWAPFSHDQTAYLSATGGGVTSTGIMNSAAIDGSFSLPATATHYQVRAVLKVQSAGSSAVAYIHAGAILETQESAS